MNEELRFKVNLKGVIDLLSKHIYKSKDVFLRELLQNSTDAITARQKIDKDFKPSITVEIYEESNTMAFIDTGIGLTEEDIHKFISTIGQSSKGQILQPGEVSDYIGHFGIGLLSCFMVSDKIVMISRHATSDQGYVWEGSPDGLYNIKKAEEQVPIGTTVYLTASQDAGDYFSFEKIRHLLHYYGNILPFPIHIRQGMLEAHVNEELPIWYGGFAEVDKQQVLDHANAVFEDNFLDAFPIYSKAGGVRGAAFVLGRRANPNNKQMSRIYLKRMFLSETSKDILPQWAYFIRVIINADKLTPTASREEFYDNDTLALTRDEIGVSLKKYLLSLPANNEGLFEKFLAVHGLTLKSLAVDDEELFALLISKLTFQTSLGDMKGQELMRESTINYTSSLEEFRQNAPIFNAQNELLVNGGYVYDTQLLEKISEVYPNIDVVFSKSDDLLNLMVSPDINIQNLIEQIINEVNHTLKPYDCKAEFRRFSPVDLPCLVTGEDSFGFFREIKNAEERTNELFSSIIGQFKEDFDVTAIICFNVDNALVQKLIHMTKTEDIRFVTEMLYCQAMIMGHYPLKKGELKLLNKGILRLLSFAY